MPLRTVGRWMGNLSWDVRAACSCRVLRKSDSRCGSGDRTHKEGVKYVGATGHATLDKGVKVLVDGKQQIFQNQKGINLGLFAVYQNSCYSASVS